MSMAEPAGIKKIVLVGAGLANLRVVSQSRVFHKLGAQLILLDTNPFWFFSNMVSEVLGGYYGLRDFYLDLRALPRQFGIEFIRDEVQSLLPQQKKIMTASGRIVAYDLICFAMGSLSAVREGDVPAAGTLPVKPVKNVLQIRNEIETCLELFPDKCLEVVVLGAGVTGVEYTLNIADLLEERNPPAGWDLTLVEARPRILPALPLRAGQVAERMLLAYDVKLRTGSEIQHIQSNRLVFEYGEILDFDLAVVALGERVPDLFVRAGLDTNEFGALRVEATLRSHNHPEIFAAGDCAQVKDRHVRPSTQNAFQQGALVAKNLQAALTGKPLAAYSGIKYSQQLVSLGKTNALWLTDFFVLQGKWIVKLKHWQDRRMMRRLRTYSI